MRVVIAGTMPEPSIDVHTIGVVAGLKAVRPDWEIIAIKPAAIDRSSSSLSVRIWKYYERFWHFPRMIAQQKADIFHIIEPCEGHLVYHLKKKQKQVPVVVTCHDLINFYYRDNVQNSVKLPIVSSGAWEHSVKGMKYADHIISVSAATAKDTTELLGIEPARITVAPNAVDTSFRPASLTEKAAIRQKYGISPDKICLLTVGSIHPRKNTDNILKAVKILVERGFPLHFLKAGAEFSSEQKHFIASHGLHQHISYIGKPDKSTLIQIYGTADILLTPSVGEGFGMTILEAMACGTPVVTSNTSAMPEVAGDAGVLVDPKDPESIADGVCLLHQDPIYYQELVKRGLVRVKPYTWDNTAEKIAQVYEKLLDKTATSQLANTGV